MLQVQDNTRDMASLDAVDASRTGTQLVSGMHAEHPYSKQSSEILSISDSS